MRGYSNILSLLLVSSSVLAQSYHDKLGYYIEEIIEQAVSSSSDPINPESIVEGLEWLYTSPLNINTCSGTELDKLWILNDFQIASLLDYRQRMGQIISIHELNYVYGFTRETVSLIKPFVYIGETSGKRPISAKEIFKQDRHEVILRAGQNNVKNKNYLGNNQKYYARYKSINKNGINIGVLAEKDAGEDFFGGSNPNGFDFYSGFVQYSGGRTVKTVVLGDYKVKSGQGLLTWCGYSTGKSSQIASAQKRGQGIQGNTSADEYAFFRGSAISLGYKKIKLNVYGSYKDIDATADSVLQGISTIRKDGLHRTTSELRYEGYASQILFGGNLRYIDKQFQAGLNYLNVNYSLALLEPDKIYQHNNFTGSQYHGISFDYKLLIQRFQLFGEVAYGNNRTALINGLNLMPHPDFLVVLLHRKYEQGYYSPYSNALAENSSTNNEEGLFAGIQWKTNWKISLSCYTDMFSFSWPKPDADAPSKGKEYLIEAVYCPIDDLELQIRYKMQNKEKNYNENSTSPMNSTMPFIKQSYRVHLRYYLSEKLSMATRYEQSASGFKHENYAPGYLLYQDVSYSIFSKLQVRLRYSWYDIADYDSRIYAYENNARFVYSMPAYYGKGNKSYVMLKYNANNWLTIWGRYSYNNIFDESSIDKHEGLLQLMFTF